MSERLSVAAQLADELVADDTDDGPRRPWPAEQVERGYGYLLRTDLRELGLERRAIDSVFRECPVIVLPGYSRPMVQVEAYLALLEGSTYCDRCGDRVRPS